MAIYIGPWQEYKLSLILKTFKAGSVHHESPEELQECGRRLEDYFQRAERLMNANQKYQTKERAQARPRASNLTKSNGFVSSSSNGTKVDSHARIQRLRNVYMLGARSDANLMPSSSLDSIFTETDDRPSSQKLINAGGTILAKNTTKILTPNEEFIKIVDSHRHVTEKPNYFTQSSSTLETVPSARDFVSNHAPHNHFSVENGPKYENNGNSSSHIQQHTARSLVIPTFQPYSSRSIAENQTSRSIDNIVPAMPQNHNINSIQINDGEEIKETIDEDGLLSWGMNLDADSFLQNISINL